MTDEQYKQRIAELEAEIEEDNKLIEAAYNKIEEMKLREALAESSHTKKSANSKQIKAYEAKIAELQQCVDLFSSDYFSSKVDEMDIFLKRTIAVRAELNDLKSKKRIREIEILRFEDMLDKLSEDICTRMMDLLRANQVMLKQLDSLDDTTKEYITNININLGVLREILSAKDNKINKLTMELDRLRNKILNSNTDIDNIEVLKAQLEKKTAEAEAYKLKAEALEFELKK